MKKFIYLMLLVFTIPLVAQESEKTITVVGETEKTVIGNKYSIIISLKQIIADGYQQMEPKSLDQVKELYAKKLKENGLDFSKFKRNVSYEFAVSYSEKRETSFYHFSTTNENEVRKIFKLAVNGTTIVNVEVTTEKLTYEQLAILSNKAIDDAKIAAKLLAKKINKNIGAILRVIDNNSKTQFVNSYGINDVQTHNVTVTFELKD
ncbi:MAG: hypothetical protein V3U92_19390 [Cellulophaga sp.]